MNKMLYPHNFLGLLRNRILFNPMLEDESSVAHLLPIGDAEFLTSRNKWRHVMCWWRQKTVIYLVICIVWSFTNNFEQFYAFENNLVRIWGQNLRSRGV